MKNFVKTLERTAAMPVDRGPTGDAVVVIVREALKQQGLDPANVTASIQGFGNLAQQVARGLIDAGGTVMAVSSPHAGDERAFVYRRSCGVDPDELALIADGRGGIDMARAIDLGYDVRPGSSWLEQAVDVLIAAAPEARMTAVSTNRVHGRVKLIVAAASDALTSDTRAILAERGIAIVTAGAKREWV